ncbi:MAG TPA: D-alanine--D-alanine ligase [Gammaproteobacteria bacterium]
MRRSLGGSRGFPGFGAGRRRPLRETFANVLVFELDAGIGDALKNNQVDVVFPVLHGPPGEDGTFQGFLEILKMPYVGSGVHASACAMDKVIAKHFFHDAGLPVARDRVISRRDDIRAAAQQAIAQLGSSLIVKPARQGSALGVAFTNNAAELEAALKAALAYDERILVEERITGKEITAGILERNGVEALPVIEVRTPPGSWYDYEHRYTPEFSQHVIPAGLPEEQYLRTQEIAKQAHMTLGCRDLSRVDFIVPDHGEPVILEVNTLPGMTPTSLYPEAARAAGLSFGMLVALLVKRALSRAGAIL